MKLVPDGFEVPAGLETERFRLRMLTVRDVVADFEAIRDRAPGLTLEQNLIDLGWHQKEFQRRSSFAYTVVDPADDGHVLGCAYIYPTDEFGVDAVATCWVRSEAAGLDVELYEAFRAWIERECRSAGSRILAAMPDLWIPGAQQPSMEEFVDRIHRQVQRFAEEHGVEEASMEVELYDGAVFHVRSLSPDPGFGFVTLRPYAEHEAEAGVTTELIVPVGTLRRITLAASGAPHPRFGFSLPAPS